MFYCKIKSIIENMIRCYSEIPDFSHLPFMSFSEFNWDLIDVYFPNERR